jgi:hypothetical protein
MNIYTLLSFIVHSAHVEVNMQAYYNSEHVAWKTAIIYCSATCISLEGSIENYEIQKNRLFPSNCDDNVSDCVKKNWNRVAQESFRTII